MNAKLFRCFRSRVLLSDFAFSRLMLMAAAGYLQILIVVTLVATLLVSMTFSSHPTDSPSSGLVFTFHPVRRSVTSWSRLCYKIFSLSFISRLSLEATVCLVVSKLSGGMRWAVHVVLIGSKKNAHCNMLVELKRRYNTEDLGVDGKIF